MGGDKVKEVIFSVIFHVIWYFNLFSGWTMFLQIYRLGLISFKINLLDDKTTLKTQLVLGNYLFNRICSLHPTASRAIQKFGSFWKVPHFRSVLSTLGICLFSSNVIYCKHYKPALSHIMKVKIVLREPYFFPLKQKGISSRFPKKCLFYRTDKTVLVRCSLLKNNWQVSFEADTINSFITETTSYRN